MHRDGELVDDLDKVHGCKQCNATFLFDAEMAEHQATTGHREIFEIPFGSDESLR